MAVVYILHSPSLDIYYTGSCLDLDQRLEEHRTRTYKRSFTARANDWELFLKIENLGYEQSRAIETHIKRMKSRAYIRNLSDYPQLIEKLRTRYP